MTRALFFLLVTATPALAQGSNIALGQYPAPTCTKPQAVDETQKPVAPRENASNDMVDAYNRHVDVYNAGMRSYNAQMTAYNGCMQAYIANGKPICSASRVR
jgi:hypothetical protein